MANIETRSESPAVDKNRRHEKLVTFIPARDLLAQPRPIDWLVRHILIANTTVAVVGDPATFKSAFMLDVAACIATGRDFHGRPVGQGRAALILTGEGNAGTTHRLTAWVIENESLDTAPLFFSTGGIGLTDPLNALAVETEVERVCALYGVVPGLVVVDTLARNFGPRDENSSADMSCFISNLDMYVRQKFNCTVVIVHHTGHGDSSRARGSSALRAAVDTEIMLERPRVGRVVTVRCTKSKDAPEFTPIAFEPHSVELPWTGEDGNPETSFVLRPTDVPASKATAERLGRNDERALSVLHRLYDDARQRLVKAGRDGDDAAIRIDEWQKACGFDDRRRFSAAKISLEQKKVIRVDHPHVFLCPKCPNLSENGRGQVSCPVLPPLKRGGHEDSRYFIEPEGKNDRVSSMTDATGVPYAPAPVAPAVADELREQTPSVPPDARAMTVREYRAAKDGEF